jgi:hypothetical protein
MSIMRPHVRRRQILGAAVPSVLAVLALAALGVAGAGACANTTETAQLHIVPAIVLDSGPMAMEDPDASAALLALAVGDAGRCPVVEGAEGAQGASSHPSFRESFEQPSGLLTIHYPSGFDVNPDSDTLTFLQPGKQSGVNVSSLVTFTSNPDPVSLEVEEYAKAMQDAREKALSHYALLSKTKTCCLRDIVGIETRWKFDETGDDGPFEMRGRACMFVRDRHGYSVMYSFDPKRPNDEPKLKAIVDAVELTRANDEEPRSRPSEPSRRHRRPTP